MTGKRRLSSELHLPNIITQEIADKAIIILNRPRYLNAMSCSLCEELYKALKRVEKDKSLIILKGAGDKAFSAGGDLISITSATRRNDFNYISNLIINLNVSIYLIRYYKIPVIALWNGIAFGGGAGLPIFAKYRIITEKTLFSMPEVKIAFHPNAAATYFFNHSKGKLGYYLALTGDTLPGADIVHAGYATHFCHTSNMEKLETDLLNCSTETDINDVIERYCEKNLPEFSLEPVMDKINNCFSQPTIEEIIVMLKKDGSTWAEKTLSIINQCSPTSLKVILSQLQRGKDMDLIDCLLMESNLTVNFFKYPDVFEGTRVTLQDKNDSPKWSPSSLSQVTEDLIESHFKPFAERQHRDLLHEVISSRY